MLNQQATAPYTINHTAIDSVYPLQTSYSHEKISSLVFMDDSTLISSSKQGMEHLLTISKEFNIMNNISANHSKYVLMSNATTDSHNEKFSLLPSDLNIGRSITISHLKKNDSFRFLGVWFNIEHSNKFVFQQITTKYNRFVSLLSSKMLTDKQLVYLHNSVLIPMVEYKMQVTPFTESNVIRWLENIECC